MHNNPIAFYVLHSMFLRGGRILKIVQPFINALVVNQFDPSKQITITFKTIAAEVHQSAFIVTLSFTFSC